MNPARSALPTPQPCQDPPALPKNPHMSLGDIPGVPERRAEREVPHVPRRDVPGAHARPSGHRACGGAGWGHAALGGRRWPRGARCLLSPPVTPVGAKDGPQPWHPTDPTAPHSPGQKRWRGLQGDSCDTPGCHPRLLAAPGSAGGPWAALGTLTPPGYPAQSHPINRVQGSPLGTATPGGLGRAPGAN